MNRGKSSRGKSAKGADRKQAIMVRAREVLVREGYDALVLRTLAADLGITIGNLQYYFATRESLVEAVVRAEALTDLEDLERFCGESTDEESFTAFLRHIIKKWRGDSGRILGIMGFLSFHNETFGRMYVEIYDRFYEGVGEALRCFNSALSKKESVRRARLITALLDGASVQVQRGEGESFSGDVARIAFQIARE